MDFEFIQPELAKERPVIAVDLIGFGLSDQSVSLDYSKKAMADTIAGLMALLDYDRYDVLGHSMGGEVALHLALNHQDRVGRLILLDSAGLLTAGMPGTEGSGRTAGASPFLIDLVFKNTIVEKRVFRTCLYEPKPFMPLAFEKLYYFVGQIPPETLARFIEDNDSGAVADRLGEIRQPTRIIWGEQDRIIPLSQGEALKDAIPGSRLDVIAECGHLPYLEQPEELIRLIRAFLAE
jgi:pimeloyl-ACP methyl ester carboxylesterase